MGVYKNLSTTIAKNHHNKLFFILDNALNTTGNTNFVILVSNKARTDTALFTICFFQSFVV